MKEYTQKIISILDKITPSGKETMVSSLQSARSISPNKGQWVKALKQRWGIIASPWSDPTGKFYITYRGDSSILEKVVENEVFLEMSIQETIKEEVGHLKDRNASVTLKGFLYTEFYNDVMSLQPLQKKDDEGFGPDEF